MSFLAKKIALGFRDNPDPEWMCLYIVSVFCLEYFMNSDLIWPHRKIVRRWETY